MFDAMLRDLKCPVCLEGELVYNQLETFEDYSDIFELDDIDDIVDGVIDQYLVFNCSKCDASPRLRFKDIEFMVRKDISQHVMKLKAIGEIERGATLLHKYYIYCGGCSGMDGRGSCPKEVYKNCIIKKVPNVL